MFPTVTTLAITGTIDRLTFDRCLACCLNGVSGWRVVGNVPRQSFKFLKIKRRTVLIVCNNPFPTIEGLTIALLSNLEWRAGMANTQ
jgi:hypothetical protein